MSIKSDVNPVLLYVCLDALYQQLLDGSRNLLGHFIWHFFGVIVGTKWSPCVSEITLNDE